MLSFIIIALGASVAGFIQGLSGFAFGLVAMSFWAWTIEPKLVVSMVAFGALTGQALAAIIAKRKFHVSVLLPFLMGGLLGVPLGVIVLPYLDINKFKALLGLILVFWCPVMLVVNRLPRITKGGRVADGIVGGLGGIMSGLGGVAGIIPTLWCTLRGFNKETQRAVIQNFNLVIISMTMVGYISTGIVTVNMIPTFMLIAFSMLIPVYAGIRLYHRISEALFRQVILILLSMSGVALLSSSLRLN